MQIKRQPLGRIDWKKTFKGAQPGDSMLLPVALRGTVHGAARAAGLRVKAEVTHDKKSCVVTVIDARRAEIFRDFERMPERGLIALHKAAKQGGLI